MSRSVPLRAGAPCAVLLAFAVLLPAAPSAPGPPPDAVARLDATGPLLVRHAGVKPVTVDTTVLAGPVLRVWWVDAVGDRAVDAGAVPRRPSVTLHPPDTGDGAPHDWTLVVVDTTRGLLPP